MSQDDAESIFFLCAGPVAAILLGMVLVPVRGYTSASNLTFAFMALTILVAEYGGRWAAVATALCSALSLDFFLTQPYLRLTIADKHDIIAFAGLAVCGLLAAAFGTQRSQRIAELRSARKLLDLLHEAIARLEGTEPLGSRLARVLDAARAACPIAAAAIRDERDAVLAGFEQGEGTRPVPARLLSIQTLLPRGTGVDSRESEDAPLPVDGARLELSAGSRRIGWLDLWGNGRPATAQARRLLSDVARLIALELLLSQPGAAAARLP